MDKYNYRYMDSLFLEEYKLLEEHDIYSEHELEVVEAEKGIVLPYKVVENKKCAGVLDGQGNYISLSGFQALSPVDTWGGNYIIHETIDYIPEKVMYLGRFWKHWGHFLMDMVSRLWYVLEREPDIKIVYDSSVDIIISGVYMEFFRLLGVSEEQLLKISKPTRFKSVIVPECAYKPGICYNNKFKKIFDKVAKNALDEMQEKDKYVGKSIYFTRRQLKRKIPLEVGERTIEKLFEDCGFQIVAPEKYSLIEQIAMVRQASKIACISGTLPHNMIFAKEKSELIIVRKTNKPNYRQFDVNQIQNLTVTNIDAHISLKAVGPGGPFLITNNQNMRKFFNDNFGKCRSSKIGQWILRKIYLLWYIPVYILRNYGKNREVPIFNGREFSTVPEAKKQLFHFYIKRI